MNRQLLPIIQIVPKQLLQCESYKNGDRNIYSLLHPINSFRADGSLSKRSSSSSNNSYFSTKADESLSKKSSSSSNNISIYSYNNSIN
eukprot:Pgem_evm1s15977